MNLGCLYSSRTKAKLKEEEEEEGEISCVRCGNRKVLEVIGLVSLFNGISTFVGYLMPKLFS